MDLSPTLRIPPLRSGGVIANYLCSSRCRHCAYFCSQKWSHDYIDESMARQILRRLRENGCLSVHIGGGEPFLGGAKLPELISWCGQEGVRVDYVETNASWFTNPESAGARLIALQEAGLRTLLVSMDPFHNEFVPWRKVAGLLAACERVGMGVFPWTKELGAEVAALAPEVTHKLDEYEDRFGPGYLQGIPSRYWISMRGRAIGTFRPFGPELTADEAASAGGTSCAELFGTDHFHLDLYGNYVPGVCTGLSIDLDDLGGPIDREKYAFLTTLMDGGIAGLYAIALRDFGFRPERRFSGKCDLCYEIRRYLVSACGVRSRDLEPVELYDHMDNFDPS